LLSIDAKISTALQAGSDKSPEVEMIGIFCIFSQRQVERFCRYSCLWAPKV